MNDDRETHIARYRALLSGAYQQYWLELDRDTSAKPFLPYGLEKEVSEWSLPRFGDQMLSSNLNELINAINAWNHRLRSWTAWSRVLATINDEKDRWDVRSEFVEPLAYFCLHQPAGSRDRLTRFATQVVHVGNLRVVAGYRDVLAEDAKVFKRLQQNHKKPHAVFLRREEAEAQFMAKSSGWHEAGALMAHVQQMDPGDYRDATGDWRNRAAHGISQHFEFGEVERVTRRVGFSETKVEGHGGVEFKEDRARKSVSYVFGGYDAL
ncbi:MAG: hypothetical protein KGZ70_10030 [Hydrogenophaga sp.]|uniref:hypothetical protein n=1 Tax=Hydrogenophaga sp. TaxID=1904254 RepID=UPI001BC3FF88|nr:hypothetical protein [Hydrogenophaga sp.]MBS3912147.1 hypothetical protein [Hydrogenophaga sp.]MDO9149237.1 hypothetical protein [Hydrogenophaga sp.]MDO9606467.1 hypothetical protein [Hydrogenophaga sp.]MDP2263237.1 hypothetical protein [Hydrogenophaga sp.]